MTVLDASAAAELLVQTTLGGRVAHRLRRQQIHVPCHFDVEVVGVVRRAVQRGLISDRDGILALTDLNSLSIRRWPVHPLMDRAFELRAIHSVADAAYVALAEVLGRPLTTCDGRLARSHGHRAEIDLVS